jgi:hypothetical protein
MLGISIRQNAEAGPGIGAQRTKIADHATATMPTHSAKHALPRDRLIRAAASSLDSMDALG